MMSNSYNSVEHERQTETSRSDASDTSDREARSGGISGQLPYGVMQKLIQTRFWANICGFGLFVSSAAFLLCGIAIALFGVGNWDLDEFAEQLMRAGLSAAFIFGGLAKLAVCFLLSRYTSQIGRYVANRSDARFNAVIEAQRAIWRFAEFYLYFVLSITAVSGAAILYIALMRSLSP